MNILIWHVHGSWTTSFVQGGHTYLVPVVDGRGPEGRGRARTYDWPPNVLEVTPGELADTPIDVVVLQRPIDLELAHRWLGGRRPGPDIPAIWLEHNAPQGRVDELVHPAAELDDVAVVHVTHTNALFWDTGRAPSRVIEHGIIDPGHRYRGDLARAAVVVNEPVRRARVTGTDLLDGFAEAAPLDVFGIAVTELGGAAPGDTPGRLRTYEDLPQCALHDALAHRRAYLHPYRWTSLGLALLEAMFLGMPVVALATTDVPSAVPASAGVVSNRLDELAEGLRRFVADPDAARAHGDAARKAVVDRYALPRFLAEWDAILEEVT